MLLVFVSCKQQDAMVISVSNENLILNNGVLEFKSKPYTGMLVSQFSDGSLQSEVFYENGLKNGKENQWFLDSKLAVERTYNNGVKVGIHKAWWENGIPKFEYHFNDFGEFHGNVKEWYVTGVLYRDFNYENGQESGRQRLWKPDGNIKSNYEVLSGERFGLIGLKTCFTVTTNSDEIKKNKVEE